MSRTILIVDDFKPLLSSLSLFFESNGYSVVSASDGISAIEELQKSPKSIDLILTDLSLPRLSGIDLIKGLRKISDLPIIIMSGYINQLLDECKAYDIRKFISKPFNFISLLDEIKEVCN